RNAWAVVAKPPGTETPRGSWEIISPRLAFLPPTTSTSLILKSSNGTTSRLPKRFSRGAEPRSADMGKLQKLKPGLRSGSAAPHAKRQGLLLVRIGWSVALRYGIG